MQIYSKIHHSVSTLSIPITFIFFAYVMGKFATIYQPAMKNQLDSIVLLLFQLFWIVARIAIGLT